jgi:hypothetical protein
MSLLTSNLAAFSDDLIAAMSKVVYDNGWQNSGGVMPFADALGVFQNVLGELRAADDEGLIDGMPVALQQTIQTRLTSILGFVTNIQAGNQQVPNFTDEVDRLHLDVWQGGFRYRGKKVLGYEEKYQQIAKLAKEIEKIKEREATAATLVEQVTALHTQAQTAAAALDAARTQADAQVAEVVAIHTRAQTADTNLETQIAAIDAKVEESAESAATADAKAQAATTNEKRLQDFINRVDANEKKLTDALQVTNEALAEHAKSLSEFMATSTTDVETFKTTKTTELDEFQERLKVIEKDITDKLAKATGITLFHAFEKREGQIKGHWIWLAIAGTVLATVIGMTAYFVTNSKPPHDAVFYIKLSLGIPAAIFIGFALQQYGRERRLKEEYAFKSSISLSLEAYRKLVEQAVETLIPDDKAKFADFLVHSIGVIFDSPTERVFGTRRTGGPTDTKIIAGLIQNLKDVKELTHGK